MKWPKLSHLYSSCPTCTQAALPERFFNLMTYVVSQKFYGIANSNRFLSLGKSVKSLKAESSKNVKQRLWSKSVFSSFIWVYSLQCCTDEVAECLTPPEWRCYRCIWNNILCHAFVNCVCKNLKDSNVIWVSIAASISAFLEG